MDIVDYRTAKKQIRKEVLESRERLSKEERANAARLLAERICTHPWFVCSDILLAFVSYGSEIDTSGIITEALKQEKKVYVPRVEGAEIQFYRMADWTDLQAGYKGILEPLGNTECFVYCPEAAERLLMLMPGVAFDKGGQRCGYGKGFYDRYLDGKEALQEQTIGVGFQCQMVEEIPAEEWDVKPGQIICV